MLGDTLTRGRMSQAVIGDLLNAGGLSRQDTAFAIRLYLGVLERLVLLDYNIEAHSAVKFSKIKPVIKNILRCALYQMYFMDSVPDRAAVSEAVKLVHLRRMDPLKGFVNGLLRTIQREGLIRDMPEWVRLSAPRWICEKLTKDLGREAAEAFLTASLTENKGVSLSFNTRSVPAEEIIRELEGEGCRVKKRDAETGAWEAELASNNIEELTAFKRGHIYVQSLNSLKAMKAVSDLISVPAPRILDVCAAPGGKSIALSGLHREGEIISADKSDEKRALIEENIKRLGITNIRAITADARSFLPEFEGKFDLVLADVPCSGLGVIGQKPDIKHRINENDIKSLSNLQKDVIKNAVKYVKTCGVFAYSTCTLTREENEDNGDFTESLGFKREFSTTYLKDGEKADGFFIAAFRKN